MLSYCVRTSERKFLDESEANYPEIDLRVSKQALSLRFTPKD